MCEHVQNHLECGGHKLIQACISGSNAKGDVVVGEDFLKCRALFLGF